MLQTDQRYYIRLSYLLFVAGTPRIKTILWVNSILSYPSVTLLSLCMVDIVPTVTKVYFNIEH